jgi:hypothetical protein
VRGAGRFQWPFAAGAAAREEVAALRRELAAAHAKLDRLGASIERLTAAKKQDAKWKRNFRVQLASLVRAQYLASSLPADAALELRRFRLRSQNEEDGIILALLQAAGVETRRFVEIGSGGSGGNSAVLAYELGWSGLMVDASGAAVKSARAAFAAKPLVRIEHKMVTTENINRLMKRFGFKGDVDFLSIDVDSIDYWLLDTLFEVRARVLSMEYNAYFGPTRAVTVPNVAPRKGTPKGYYGASLAALDLCARRKGYRLVLCEDAGVNAFFVREDLAGAVPTLTPAAAWRPKSNRYDVSGEEPLVEADVFRIIEERQLPLVEV